MNVVRLAVLLAIWPLATARAEREHMMLFSAPLILGGTDLRDGGVVWGMRPELVSAWFDLESLSKLRGLGVGGYGELLSADGERLAGVGATSCTTRRCSASPHRAACSASPTTPAGHLPLALGLAIWAIDDLLH